MPATNCECTEPGWCPRHRCHKTRRWYDVCRTRPQVFRAWEEGRGPLQKAPASFPARAACVQRGTELREQACRSCAGRIRIKVFRCALYGQCTLARPLEQLACCARCSDYEPAEASGAS